ncbi:MAG: LacI family DNA-binding transcriptional regulator [Acidimicrobiales bacterium]
MSLVRRVSSATVSRALRGHSNVSDETRMRIEQVANELNYRPNASAARLASKTSAGVALVVPALDGWYFSTVMAGVESALSAEDSNCSSTSRVISRLATG